MIPKSFGVKWEDTPEWKKYIDYLNINYNSGGIEGTLKMYYGIDSKYKGILSVGNFKYFDNIYTAKEFLELINEENKTETIMKYKITRSQFKEIYDIACDTWKKRIQTLTNDTLGAFSDEGEVTEQVVKDMFEASSDTQKEVLKKIFTEYNKDKNAFVNTFRWDELQEISYKLFNNRLTLSIAGKAKERCNKADLDGRALYVNGDYDVFLHKNNETNGTYIEIKKK